MIRQGLSIAVVALPLVVGAADHNNVDAGRPLRFDDAYSIAFGERALEFGLQIEAGRRTMPVYGLKAEFKYGFAKNQDIGIGFSPSYATNERLGDLGNVELSYFHGFQREIGNNPALGYRVDVELPTGRDARGVDVHLRGVATRAMGQFDKLHLNLDVAFSGAPAGDERRTTVGAILGYSKPLGYPRRFDRTLVAEFGIRQSETKDDGWVGNLGVGLRRQIGVRSVLDVGVSSDLLGTKRADRSRIRLTAGISLGF